MKNKSLFKTVFWTGIALALFSCNKQEEYYSAGDFESLPKTDAHFHYLTYNQEFMKFAAGLNFRLLSPNWDVEYSIDEQLKITKSVLLSK